MKIFRYKQTFTASANAPHFHTFFIDKHFIRTYNNKNRILQLFLCIPPPGFIRRFFPVFHKNNSAYSFLYPRCGAIKEVPRGLYHI